MEYTFTLPQIMSERNLTQARVSKLTGISKNGVSNLCRSGLVQIRVDTIGKICDGLGVTPGELFVPDSRSTQRRIAPQPAAPAPEFDGEGGGG